MSIFDPPSPEVTIIVGPSEVSSVFEQVQVAGEPQIVESAAISPIAFSDTDGVPEVLGVEDELTKRNAEGMLGRI